MPPRKKGKLTDLQRRFAIEYALDQCAKRAAIRAGCPPAGARTTAWEWLNLPEYAHVRAACDEQLDRRLDEVKAIRRDQFRELDRLSRAQTIVTGLKIKEALQNKSLIAVAEAEATKTGRDKHQILMEMVLDEDELAAVTLSSISYFQGAESDGQGVTLKFKTWNKPQASGLVLKHFGQLPEAPPADDAEEEAAFEKAYVEARRNFEVEEGIFGGLAEPEPKPDAAAA